ncbi:rps18 (chloroplast) [Auxenochlorella protothecoides x Auxenochlorella symbiontica]|uniref:Small ribosomal subunit protein bS18c n=1 Tax=Auxenochlorella protothecoides TaxID=3075 RepID=A0A023HI01_AUXPR|nr:ribosomal protein S18 [Auxenochlorella protothecoides]AGL10921.1 ribosomal protein S18 [Auxenochlorella protothecoides]AGN72477.1 ribosomal protein S18 [Auxenochlorella protothecoides]ARU77485.1 ribosomal protein S18p [Auxenochlorella protothecoides]
MKSFKNTNSKNFYLQIKKKLNLNESNSRYTIDYKNTKLLMNFISPQGKILSKKITGLTSKQQRTVATAIKRGRMSGLLPFVNRYLVEN